MVEDRRLRVTSVCVVVCGLVLGAAMVVPAEPQPEVAARFRQQKVALLQEALKAAQEAGLDLLVEKITDQLAETSLQAGDLAGARAALLGIIERIEARREQLAFDPLLRQQWFADNIGPYRKLLRVAALQGDAMLALSVAERMRTRALADQLAWQKVDWDVTLAPEDAERLAWLRSARQEAYGLLQWALGGSRVQPAEGSRTEGKQGGGVSEYLRGYYMPVRGMYMPIRGPLDSGEVAGAEDVRHLKELLDKLAKEEAALESAIREQVPAYAAACETTTASGEELLAAVAGHPGLAIIQYTLCENGLVAAAFGFGKPPTVVLIPEKGDKLWERIGKFRELIWERKDEVFQEAAALYQTLVAPVEHVLRGAQRLWIVADGALHLVPFGALIGGDGIFMAWKLPIACAPSLSLLLSTRGPHEPGQGALIVAAPDTGFLSPGPLPVGEGEQGTATAPFPPPSQGGGQGGRPRGFYMPIRGMYMPVRGFYMPIRGEDGIAAALSAMATVPLPGAQAEGQAIAERLPGAKLMTGKDATKARLLADGGACDILHIATHGYADPDFPEFSGLLLAGEGEEPYQALTAQEVYLWRLRARLVTLSACQTAMGKDVEGEGVLGLTRAFIFAGAENVVCSLWPVADESTKILMAWFYVALQQGKSVEEALQTAQKVLIQAKDTNHPFFWAGFTAMRGTG